MPFSKKKNIFCTIVTSIDASCLDLYQNVKKVLSSWPKSLKMSSNFFSSQFYWLSFVYIYAKQIDEKCF